MKFLDLKTEDVTKQQLENASWNETVICVCYDYVVTIRSAKDGYLEELKRKMPINFELCESEELNPHFNIFITETSDRELVFFFFDKLVPRLKYQFGEPTYEQNFEFLIDMLGASNAARNENYVVLHAGAVSYNGIGIIFPADSYSGKSTLTAEFVKQGATYYSDEYAVISRDGRLFPYIKPISLREPGGWDQTDFDVRSFGGKPGNEPNEIGYILFTKFKKFSRWNPEFISPVRAVFEMLPHSMNGKNNPEFTIQVLQNVTKKAKVLKSSRGESGRFVKDFLNSCKIDS
jgi:hypothetical protein